MPEPAPILLDAAPAPRPARLLWRRTLPAEVTAAHDDPSDLPAVHRIEVPGLLAGGLAYGGQGLTGQGGRVVDAGLAPAYMTAMLLLADERNALDRTWIAALRDPAAAWVRHDGPVLVPVHPNWGWGHVLVEVLPRLLLLHESSPADWPVALAATAPGWLRGLVEAAAPGRPLLRFDPATEVVAAPLLVGASEPVAQARLRPALLDRIDAMRARLAAALPPPAEPLPRRIWVSRAGLGGATGRRIMGAPEVEAAAAARGFVAVRPETLSLAEQARLFAGAEAVAGAYGSGLHNTLFSGPRTLVVALNWINAYQSNIASARRHVVGFVIPDDGRFRDASRILLRGERKFPFSPERVARKLDEALEAVGLRPGGPGGH